MRTIILTLVAAVGAAAFTGSGKAAPAMPGWPAAVSGYETAQFTDTCPAGSYWKPAQYNRWGVWYPDHCAPDSEG